MKNLDKYPTRKPTPDTAAEPTPKAEPEPTPTKHKKSKLKLQQEIKDEINNDKKIQLMKCFQIVLGIIIHCF